MRVAAKLSGEVLQKTCMAKQWHCVDIVLSKASERSPVKPL
jgi:hypothetical protein